MSEEYYEPQTNGINGLEEFGDGYGEHAHFGDYRPKGGRVYRGGVPLMGHVTEPTSVAEFVKKHDIRPTVRLQKVYCSPTAPDTIATRVDRRRGWRYEAVVGLPDKFRGPTKVATGALRFVPGWDARLSENIAQTAVYVDSDGVYHAGKNGAGVTSREVTYGSTEE